MKRSTYAVVAVLAALGGVWALQQREKTPDAPAPLAFDGLVTAPDAETARSLLREAPPATIHLTLRRPDGEQIVLEAVALAEGATPEKLAERAYTASRTTADGSSKAKAMGWKVGAMVEVFASPLRSTFAQPLAAKDAADYGLDSAHAIEVEAKLAGKTYGLRVGAAMKSEGSTETSTWVQRLDRPDVVYQLAGLDLHTPFAVAWSELRDRQLLVIDTARLFTIALHNPAGEDIAVERAPLAAGGSREPGEGWQITAPAGLPPGNIAEWVNALKNLSANQFVDAKAAAEGGFDAPTAATLRYNDGAEVTLTLGNAVKGVSGELVWLRIAREGRTEYVQIAKFARDQLVRRASQVRDRRLGGAVQAEAVSAFTLDGPGTHVAASLHEGSWRLDSNGAQLGDAEAIRAYVSELLPVQVDYAVDTTPVGLDQPEWKLVLTTPTGTTQIALSKETGGKVWGQQRIAGQLGDPFTLPAWSADKLRKTPAHFADKRLVPATEDQIAEVALRPAGGEPLVLRRLPTGWSATLGKGAAAPCDKTKVDAWLASLVHMRGRVPASGADPALGLSTATEAAVLLTNGSRYTLRFAAAKDAADSAVEVKYGAAAARWLIAASDAAWATKTTADFR